MKKLAIIVTHPIQYNVPVFQLLAQNCHLKVFYTWGKEGVQKKYDPDFKKFFEWDIPLLEGYNYELLENIASQPGSHHGKGINNPAIIEKVLDFNPDAILVYGWIYQSHLKVMRFFKGKVPIWFRGDSTLLDSSKGIKSLLKKIYLRWIYKDVDLGFYVGQHNKAYFNRYGLKDQHLVFAPHAIDNDRFAEDRQDEVDLLRKELAIENEDILILFAGKLEPKKNPALLLETFIKLNNEPSPKNKVHLLFVGNGILEQELKMRVESTKSKNVHFIDFQNQTKMPVFYQACDIFCLPSAGPGETWGLAINEAMAAGKAIIASNKAGGAIDLVKDGFNGYVFTSNDMEELKYKLSLLITQPTLLKSFGEQSRAIINHWSFKQQVNQIIKTLNATD